MLFIILVVCVVLCFIVLFSFVLCIVQNDASVSGMTNLDLPSVFSNVYLTNTCNSGLHFVELILYKITLH